MIAAFAALGIYSSAILIPATAWWLWRSRWPSIAKALVTFVLVPAELLVLVWALYVTPVVLGR